MSKNFGVILEDAHDASVEWFYSPEEAEQYKNDCSAGTLVHRLPEQTPPENSKLFSIRDIMDAASEDYRDALELRMALNGLADEMNDALDGYEVRVIHLDTEDYLEMISRESEDHDE